MRSLVLLMALMTMQPSKHLEKATFAGGCFWCMEGPFEARPGVTEVAVGYIGGAKENPTYEEVCTGTTGHFEAIQIMFDPAKVTYNELLDIFWRQIDPTDAGGQFADRGPQYRSAVFYHNEEQKRQALALVAALAASGRFDRPIATLVLPAAKFYTAENYHQDYYKTNPTRYKVYRAGSGRDDYLQKTWSGAQTAELQGRLTPLQFEVTQQCGTEPPFQNEHWNNKREGIYVDIVSGEPLFSSKDKFDSGTGWPSFIRPLKVENIVEKEDASHGARRVEVRSKQGDSHLGHVFPDGPEPTGLRYCINSASLRFIPKENLEKEGYGEFKKLFEGVAKK